MAANFTNKRVLPPCINLEACRLVDDNNNNNTALPPPPPPPSYYQYNTASTGRSELFSPRPFLSTPRVTRHPSSCRRDPYYNQDEHEHDHHDDHDDAEDHNVRSPLVAQVFVTEEFYDPNVVSSGSGGKSSSRHDRHNHHRETVRLLYLPFDELELRDCLTSRYMVAAPDLHRVLFSSASSSSSHLPRWIHKGYRKRIVPTLSHSASVAMQARLTNNVVGNKKANKDDEGELSVAFASILAPPPAVTWAYTFDAVVAMLRYYSSKSSSRVVPGSIEWVRVAVLPFLLDGRIATQQQLSHVAAVACATTTSATSAFSSSSAPPSSSSSSYSSSSSSESDSDSSACAIRRNNNNNNNNNNNAAPVATAVAVAAAAAADEADQEEEEEEENENDMVVVLPNSVNLDIDDVEKEKDKEDEEDDDDELICTEQFHWEEYQRESQYQKQQQQQQQQKQQQDQRAAFDPDVCRSEMWNWSIHR